jgi:hypothetical protein
MPNTSPNSSLKNGPWTPAGKLGAMSPIFLRTWYQRSGTWRGGVLSRSETVSTAWPGSL